MSMTRPPRVRTGADVLSREDFARLGDRSVGLIANPTTVDGELRHLADLLHARGAKSGRRGPKLKALFGPEHGIRGDAQDMVAVDAAVDPATGLPIHTLYGASEADLRPRPEHLERLDVLLFDVQDVGCRHYTFAVTMLYAMIAASERGLAFVVADRPNPIGGLAIEGPSIAAGHLSFIGGHPTPIRHGMTVGELALMFKAELGLSLDLEVVPCENWNRGDEWEATGLPWIPPSPNMPTPDTARVYPGACPIEGTNLSEGRGTTRPFELWGAPWLDGRRLLETALEIAGGGFPGALAAPRSFIPTFHKHEGEVCRGLQPFIHDPARFRPVRTYIQWLRAARRLDPSRFAWRTEPYEFVSDPIAVDLLYGSPRERSAIESDDDAEFDALFRSWEAEEAAFRARRRPFLLYPEPEPIPAGTLRIEGAAARPISLTFEDLWNRPDSEQVADAGRLAPGRTGGAVRLGPLLDLAGPAPSARRLRVVSARDGFERVAPLSVARERGWLVYREGAAPLAPERGGPIRLILVDVPACEPDGGDGDGDESGAVDACSNVKGVARLVVEE